MRVCGDDVMNVWEECDNWPNNGKDGKCTFECKIPKDSRKVIVYSCMIGNYDNVTSFNKQRGYDYILFTDQNIKNTNWLLFIWVIPFFI